MGKGKSQKNLKQKMKIFYCNKSPKKEIKSYVDNSLKSEPKDWREKDHWTPIR